MSKIILEESAKEYILQKERNFGKKLSLLLEYHDPCSICTGAVATWKLHLISVKEQERLEREQSLFRVEDFDVWFPKTVEEEIGFRIVYKKYFWEKEGRLEVFLTR